MTSQFSYPHSGRLRCETIAATQSLGAAIGATLCAGDVVILDGPLGAGKTTFTQGLAEGMRVKGRVTSPTFVIARLHRSISNGPDLVHVDAYRLFGEDPDAAVDPLGSLDALDLDTDLEQAVVVAEWGEGLMEQLAARWMTISIDRNTAVEEDPDSEARIISWRWHDADR
ncbi:tRNA (adenosine(37)-N6)-threonylcarbamoyltransferase complex ATPase subunit type 1 TsaE [Corynebacterium choanae]|nr:tRNA (adenosine(37)-N6)-threonylcarbamoyltransferase complex ATPase subunit type 1 TsaE [Corynebacterium choanae]